jgi:hypothetical protein
MYQARNVLRDPNADSGEKLIAGANIALAVVLESLEPDDLLPVSVPLDDVGRQALVKAMREAYEEGGQEAVERVLKDTLGDQADNLLRHLGMNAPDGARIWIPGPTNSPFGKLDYLLGRVAGNTGSITKGRLFGEVLGFTDETLDSALRSHLIDNFGNAIQDSSRGYPAFIVEGTMTGSNGVTRQIQTVWQILEDGTYSFVTAYGK